MKITVSGLSGCGNTTATKLVAGQLGLKLLNYTLRDLAGELGMTLEQIQQAAEKDPYYDYLVDFKQIKLGEKEPDFIIGSRLAGWLIEKADLRVWLAAPPQVRASRIAKREGLAGKESLQKMLLRDEQNAVRYKKYYGIPFEDLSIYDLVLDTETLSAEQVSKAIVEAARKVQPGQPRKQGALGQRVRQLVFSEVAKRAGKAKRSK